MDRGLTRINVKKLGQQLRVIRIKSALAIALGDCRAVARLTCEAGRLKDAIGFAGAVSLQVSDVITTASNQRNYAARLS